MTSSPQSWPFSWIARSHHAFVSGRRTRVLAETLAPLVPHGASVLDVGCGDGRVATLLAERRPDITVEGVELAPRPSCSISCRPFDGEHLPFPDASFDVCLFVDVLHHTSDVTQLLGEAARVTRSCVLLKDHLCENLIDRCILRTMDWISNRPHGVVLTYNYQSFQDWQKHFATCRLQAAQLSTSVPLYPFPFSLLFGRRMHFVAQLRRQ